MPRQAEIFVTYPDERKAERSQGCVRGGRVHRDDREPPLNCLLGRIDRGKL